MTSVQGFEHSNPGLVLTSPLDCADVMGGIRRSVRSQLVHVRASGTANYCGIPYWMVRDIG